MIKAIIFDAGEVVYYRDEETLKPILDFFKDNRIRVSAKQFIEAYDKHALEVYKGKISKDRHLETMLEFLKIDFDVPFFNKFAEIFRKSFSNIKINKRASETFEKIKSLGIKIGILTDTVTTEEKKWEWLKKINAARFIDAVICSSVTGHTKDEKEAYEAVLQKLKLNKEDVIFVGHKKYEMQGAKLAHIKSVSLEKDAGGDHYIIDISEVLNLINAPKNKNSPIFQI